MMEDWKRKNGFSDAQPSEQARWRSESGVGVGISTFAFCDQDPFMDPQVVPPKGKKPTANLTSGLRMGTSRNLNVSSGKNPATITLSSSLSKSNGTQKPLKTPGASTSKSRPLRTPVPTRGSVKTTAVLEKSTSKPPLTQSAQPSVC